MERVSAEELRAAERFPYAASAEALFELGLKYSLGVEGSPDLVAAQKWLSLAAMKGSAPARICRRELAREMTPEQIAEAQQQAGAWIRPH
jgi:TPR repeat protein